MFHWIYDHVINTTFFVFAAILTIVLSSCKSHEKCPAYSKKDMNKEVRS